VVVDRLVAEPLVVDLEVDVVVTILGSDIAHLHRAEGGPQMLADDAQVVLLAALSRRALLDPVVAQVIDGLVGRPRAADATFDLRDLDLLATQLRLRAPVVVEDSALPPVVLVEPPDAPLVAVLDGLGRCLALSPSKVSLSPAVPARSPAGRRRSEVAWPKSGPRMKNAGWACRPNPAGSLSCAGPQLDFPDPHIADGEGCWIPFDKTIAVGWE
jgi:hypothetical protein